MKRKSLILNDIDRKLWVLGGINYFMEIDYAGTDRLVLAAGK